MLPPLSARTGPLSFGRAVFFLTFLAAQVSICQGGEYPITAALAGEQDFPSLILSPNGGCVVWEDNRIDGSGRGIGAVRLNASLSSTGNVLTINQQTLGHQEKPHALLLDGGKILFAWETSAGPQSGIYARVLNPDGSFSGGDVSLNTPSLTTVETRAAVFPGYVRNKWKERKFKFREKIIYLRERPGSLALAALPDGTAVVAYQAGSRTETNTWGLVNHQRWVGLKGITNDYFRPLRRFGDRMQDVFFQRIDSAGAKIGSEVMVNQYASFNQRSPAITVLADGSFIVAWVSETPRAPGLLNNPGTNYQATVEEQAAYPRVFNVEIFGRRFSSEGEPLGDEFTLRSQNGVAHSNPSLAPLANGGFLLLWSQRASNAEDRWDVYGQAFGAAGTNAPGSSFRVNSYTAGDQFAPKVASSGDSALIVWTSVHQDGSREGVYGRFFSGSEVTGAEFRINGTTVSRQIHPAVGSDGEGRFLSVWSSYVGETGFDLFGLVSPAPAPVQ